MAPPIPPSAIREPAKTAFRRISTELVRFTSDGSCVLSNHRNVISSADDLSS
jgi:hypothetical protein